MSSGELGKGYLRGVNLSSGAPPQAWERELGVEVGRCLDCEFRGRPERPACQLGVSVDGKRPSETFGCVFYESENE